MSDGQNRSKNKRTPNGPTQGPSWFESIGADYARGTATGRAEQLRLEQERQDIEALQAGVEQGLPPEMRSIAFKEIGRKTKLVNALEPRIELREQTTLERYTALAQHKIRREFDISSVNGQVARLARTEFGQSEALRYLGTPYAEVESAYEANVSRLGELEKSSLGLTRGLFREGGRVNRRVASLLEEKEQERASIQRQMAGQFVAMGTQTKLGLDPRSRLESIALDTQRAGAILQQREYEKEVAKGVGLGGMSTAQLKEAEAAAAEKLKKAFEELTNGVEKSAEEIDKLKTTAEQAQNELKNISGVAGAGGGGAFGGRTGALMRKAAPYLEAAQQIFGAVAQGVQNIGVNQSLAARYNIAGLANIENQKYDAYRRAMAGDVASQMLLSQFKGAEEFGSSMKTAANVSLGSRMLGSLAATATGAATGAAVGAAGGALLGGVLAAPGAVLGGITGGIASFTNSITSATDIARGVSGNQAKIAAVGADMDAKKALIYVTAEQRQGLRDYYTGMGQVARGMGAGAEEFMSQNVNRMTLGRLSSMRMSPEQLAQMSLMGQAEMGSMFNVEQVFAARGLERSGRGTMQENMQRMATLAAAGSNNPQAGLAGVLEAAFGKSLENAKTLNMLVENTGAMATRTVGARAGLDVTAETATVLAANIDPKQENREFAIQRARTAAETADSIVTDKNVSFVNMSKMARIGRMTGMGGMDQTFAMQLDIETLNKISSMGSTQEQAAFLRSRGISATATNVGSMVAQLKEAAGISILAQGTVGQPGVNTEELYRKIRRNDRLTKQGLQLTEQEKLTEQEQTLIGRAAVFGGFATGEDLMRSINSVFAKNDPNAKNQTDRIIKGEAGGEQLKKADELLTGGFKQLADAAFKAAGEFDKFSDAIGNLVKLQKQAEEQGGVAGEKAFGEAAAKSASSTWFTEGSKTLYDAAGKLDSVAQKLIDAGMGDRSKLPPPSKETKDSRRGQGPGG